MTYLITLGYVGQNLYGYEEKILKSKKQLK